MLLIYDTARPATADELIETSRVATGATRAHSFALVGAFSWTREIFESEQRKLFGLSSSNFSTKTR
jgi:hypothetical protein